MKFIDKNTIILDDGSFFIIKKFGEVWFYPDSERWKMPKRKIGEDECYKFYFKTRKCAIEEINNLAKLENL